MRNTLFFSCIIVALLAMPSYAFVVRDVQIDFLESIDTSGNNTFNQSYFPSTQNVIWAEASLDGDIARDKVEICDINGNPSYFIIDFTYDFVPQGGGNYMANLERLDMIRNWPLDPEARPGGRFSIGDQGSSSDMDSIYFDFGTITAESDYLEGTFNTDGGGSLPVNEINQQLTTKSFYTKHGDDVRQKAVVYDGDIDVNLGIINVYTLSFDDDIMDHRAVGSADEGLGYITTTLDSVSGYDHTYNVSLEMPLEVVIEEDIDIGLGTVHTIVTAQANVVAEGQFTQRIIPGDANWDYKVNGSDAALLANNWQLDVNDPGVDEVTWEMGDFNGDGVINGSDATLLANYWQEGDGTPAPTSTVPEPGTIVLLLSALAGLALIRRRR